MNLCTKAFRYTFDMTGLYNENISVSILLVSTQAHLNKVYQWRLYNIFTIESLLESVVKPPGSHHTLDSECYKEYRWGGGDISESESVAAVLIVFELTHLLVTDMDFALASMATCRFLGCSTQKYFIRSTTATIFYVST